MALGDALDIGLGTTGQVVQTNGTTLALSTATYPLTTTINQLLFSSAANTITGLATANSGVLITSGAGLPSISSTLPSGIAATNMVLTTPNLGTPSAGTLTNCTGLPISTGVSGLGAGVATFLATPSSANLLAAMTTSTGSGNLTFATSPTLVTPTSLGVQQQALNMNSNKINNVTDPTSAQDAATKNYVDTVAAGLNPAASVTAASTGALTVTYNNGVAGIGATLTNAGAQAAFSLDGQSPTVGQRVLIKDQASGLQNGVYNVTNVGSGVTNWILTRALDYDSPSDISNTGIVPVINGTVNANTGWLQTATITTVGTDALTFIKFTSGTSGTVTSVASGTGLTGGPITSSGTLSLVTPFAAATHVAKSVVQVTNSAQASATGDGTTITIAFGTANVDRNSDFNTGTFKFTAPQAGLYDISWIVGITGIAADNTDYLLTLGVNASLTSYTLAQLGTQGVKTAGNTFVTSGAFSVNLSSSDTLSLNLSVSGHATKNISMGTSYWIIEFRQ